MKFIMFLLYCVMCFAPQLFANEYDNDKVLDELDHILDNRYVYKIEKKHRLNRLQFALSNADNDKDKFDFSEEIYKEYRTYQYDSAYFYALKSEKYANLCNDVGLLTKVQCNLLFCYSTVGLFKEGASIIDNFQENSLIPKKILADFYLECAHYYQNLAIYAGNNNTVTFLYNQTQFNYREKALNILNTDSFHYRINKVYYELLKGHNIENIIDNILELIDIPKLSPHQNAILYSWLSTAYDMVDNRDRAIYYRAVSAINDIKSCIFETTSLRELAYYMQKEGDIVRASKYIRIALDDANIYNTPFRKFEIQNILPNIEKERYDNLRRDGLILIFFTSVIILLLILIFVMFVKIRHRNIWLQEKQEEVQGYTEELSQINSQLRSANDSLNEVNRIKDQYIIQTLLVDSTFVDNIEKVCMDLKRKIRAKHYADLDGVEKMMRIKQERQRMASAFDSGFLKLYPNFINEYNKLFHPDDAIEISEGGELPTGVRIIALTKLGITSAYQISSYLNISPNTIYVYKAKIKAKTIVPKDEFDNYIKQID